MLTGKRFYDTRLMIKTKRKLISFLVVSLMAHNGELIPKGHYYYYGFIFKWKKQQILPKKKHRYFMINFACKIPLIFVTFISEGVSSYT